MFLALRLLRLLSPLRLALAAVLLLTACEGPGPRPNVVLVTIDTLRPDHLGAQGHPRAPSPAIDRLFAEGTAFRTSIVPRGQTWPTLASIQTSLYPVDHGIRKNGQPLADGVVGLAEVLRDEGWTCGAFLSNSAQVGWRGFEIVEDRRDQDRTLVTRAKAWMAARADRPFFLWIHLFSPHRPYAPPAPLDRLYDPGYEGFFDGSIDQLKRIAVERIDLEPEDLEHARALYDGEIRGLDRLVGELLGALRDHGLDGRTLVAFTADHGEELYERNHYFSHSASVYDTVLRAPLAFRWPGRIESDRWIDGVAEAIDVAPTILDLVGVEIPVGFEGRSLATSLAGPRLPLDPGHLAFSELEDRVVTVRSATHRYVHNPDGFQFPLKWQNRERRVPIGRGEIYDLREDPGERSDRSGEDVAVAVAAELKAAAIRWQIDHGWDEAGRRNRETEIPAAVLEQLEAIGYAK